MKEIACSKLCEEDMKFFEQFAGYLRERGNDWQEDKCVDFDGDNIMQINSLFCFPDKDSYKRCKESYPEVFNQLNDSPRRKWK